MASTQFALGLPYCSYGSGAAGTDIYIVHPKIRVSIDIVLISRAPSQSPASQKIYSWRWSVKLPGLSRTEPRTVSPLLLVMALSRLEKSSESQIHRTRDA